MYIYEVKIMCTAQSDGISKYRKKYLKGVVLCHKKTKKEDVGEYARAKIHDDLQCQNEDKVIVSKVVSVETIGFDFCFIHKEND